MLIATFSPRNPTHQIREGPAEVQATDGDGRDHDVGAPRRRLGLCGRDASGLKRARRDVAGYAQDAGRQRARPARSSTAGRRDREGDGDRHLWLRPASIQSSRRDDAAGRRARPRVHGRGRRGRAGSQRLEVGARVVVPFPIACGACWYCRHGLFSCCDNSNPNAELPEAALRRRRRPGSSATRTYTAGIRGGQAEFVRVPFADVGPIEVAGRRGDEQVLFLSDILPDGLAGGAYAATSGTATSSRSGGAGRSGYFPFRARSRQGAERVIAIDRIPERLRPSPANVCGRKSMNYDGDDGRRGAAEADDRWSRAGRLHRRGGAGGPRAGSSLARPTR